MKPAANYCAEESHCRYTASPCCLLLAVFLETRKDHEEKSLCCRWPGIWDSRHEKLPVGGMQRKGYFRAYSIMNGFKKNIITVKLVVPEFSS